LRKLSHLGEFRLIRLLAKRAPLAPGVIQGIGDDTAVLSLGKGPGEKFVLFTTDMIVEDVHFTRAMPASAIGRKALACNISDVAAMGGVPKFAVVSLGVPPFLEIRFVSELYQGINRLARRFGIGVVGGDTVKSQKIILSVALIGEVQREHLVTRAGARAGDVIFVTGPLGRSFETDKHLSFMPRIAESQFLVKHFGPSAMIDISDGLASDLGHIVESSHGGACLYEERIPKTPGATLKEALTDGEDFELLFTLSNEQGQRLLKLKNKKFRFYPIGEIVAQKEKITLMDSQGRKRNVTMKGFEHF